MGETDLPRDVKAFIQRHLSTGAQADVLVLLQRERRGWTAAQVGKELRIDTEQAASLLAALQRSGLLRGDGGSYEYSPRDPRLEAVADSFGRLYPIYRVAIISLIFSRPTGAIHDFSEAFRLRGDD